MNLSTDAIRKEKLSKKEVARLEQLLDEIKEASGSMEPDIYYDEAVNVDTNHGGGTIPANAFSAAQLKRIKKLAASPDSGSEEVLAEAQEILVPYMDGTELYSFEVDSGWIAHLTMPGYTDQTEPSMYPTLREAIEELHNMYGND